jgi:hypothetical protein
VQPRLLFVELTSVSLQQQLLLGASRGAFMFSRRRLALFDRLLLAIECRESFLERAPSSPREAAQARAAAPRLGRRS